LDKGIHRLPLMTNKNGTQGYPRGAAVLEAFAMIAMFPKN
jgi:hypothetical protein